ncbi:unnamed protein product [Lota lota]
MEAYTLSTLWMTDIHSTGAQRGPLPSGVGRTPRDNAFIPPRAELLRQPGLRGPRSIHRRGSPTLDGPSAPRTLTRAGDGSHRGKHMGCRLAPRGF